MKCYVAKQNVIQSIEYFNNLGLDSDDMFFLYLLSKHLGVTNSYPITYLTSKLTSTQKEALLHSVWLLGGLFDSTELCNKRGVMFPTGFRKSALYQPGTDFSSILGRIKDTVEKKNINVAIYNDQDSVLTLRNNYRDLIAEHYLNGKRISLSNLASWLFRFTSFEFDSLPTSKQFTRVIEKAVRKYFKITKNDFLWLFDNDLSTHRLSAEMVGISGDELRTLFDFEKGKEPDVQVATTADSTQINAVDKAMVDHYLALNGDNPSNDDILDILMSKRQIVLTGVPGVGKSRYTKALADSGLFYKTEMIQFHASYSYEDFIGSETLKAVGGTTEISTKKGTFLEFVNKASEDKDLTHKYLFIIDELNRGNIAEIFGETILALDRDYTVKLNRDYDGISELRIPNNLYIVATMNTSDRNIAFLDLAIRRRFAFIPLYPNYDFLSEEVELTNIDLGNVLKIMNQRIIDTLKDSELILGQSYFIPEVNAGKYVWDYLKFKNQFNFVILPTLKEYSFNDETAITAIIGDQLGDGLQELDDFQKAFEAEFSL